MLRSEGKRALLPSPHIVRQPVRAGLPGAPGIGAAMDGEVDWGLVTPPVSDAPIWFDAYDFKTLSGTGTLSQGVYLWLDKASATVNHLAQATSGFRPTYGSRRFGQYYGVEFDGTDDFMDMLFNMPARPMSIVMAYDLDSVAGSNKFLISGTGGNNAVGIYITQTTGILKVNFVGVTDVSSSVAPGTGKHVIGIALSTSQVKFCIDGTISTVSDSTSTTARALRLGEYGGGGTNYLDGAIGEVFVWDRELTSQELQDQSAYLKAKWYTA